MRLAEVIDEVTRECAMRRAIYPRMTRDGKLSEEIAEKRLDRMETCLALLWRIKDSGVTNTDQWVRGQRPTHTD